MCTLKHLHLAMYYTITILIFYSFVFGHYTHVPYRGCKFVGHGLQNDFRTVNLFVPPCQIIDTVDIFRMENKRLISLRFLVNYLLQRDMQVEIHDSIEDSRAANELYLKALELKENGTFEEILRNIYERGQQTDWKVAELTR